jgi:hypothetical protein
MSATEEIISEKLSRRSLLTKFGAAGVGAAATAMLAGCGGSSSSNNGATSLNQKILNAAATAEALATVMYYNIIHTSPLYSVGLAGNAADQAYLKAGLEQEANHYYTLVAAGAVPLATTFYFPTGMFSDTTYKTTVDTVVFLEYAFIAAYLIGVRDLSTTSLKVLAAQIMGVEAEHRTLARVIANDVNLATVPDIAGAPEGVTPPTSASNNIAYERTYSGALPNIDAVVSALGPYVGTPNANFSTTPYAFNTTANFYPIGSPVTQDQQKPNNPD